MTNEKQQPITAVNLFVFGLLKAESTETS